MTSWVLVAVIVLSTVAGDFLQTIEMKRHGEINDFAPSGISRHLATLLQRKYLILAIVFMAISFFAFMKLVTIADLSFAVPATAGSLVLETIVAKFALGERVDAHRWAGASLVAFGVALLGQ